MSRWIDADALKRKINDVCSLCAIPLDYLFWIIDFAPTIEVDRPRGEWIDVGGYEVCKNCHEVKRFPHWKFCPNCGSDNRERSDT